MNELILYLLKSTFSLSLLYLAFRTMMRKEVFFALNRSMLLAIVIFSFIIPLLHLPSTVKPIIQEQVIQQVSFYNNETEPTTAVENINYGTPASIQVADQQEAPLPFSKEKIITLIYLAGMLFSFLVFIHGILSVLLLLGKAKAVRKDGYLIFILEKDIPAFSFWKLIFISKTDYMENGTTILTHEIQHIRLGHFYDLMLMEMVKMIHWFNPVIYWLIQDMKAIHEFQADQHTLSKGIDVNKYQLLIIEKGVGSQRFALANSFNHCQIKKRITMINQTKNGKAGMWKVATFLPLLALLLIFCGRKSANEPDGNSFSFNDQSLKLDQCFLLFDGTTSPGKFEIELVGGNVNESYQFNDTVKVKQLIVLSMTPKQKFWLTDGKYKFSSINSDLRPDMSFLGSVRIGTKLMEITAGELLCKRDSDKIDITFKLNVDNEQKIKGSYSGNYENITRISKATSLSTQISLPKEKNMASPAISIEMRTDGLYLNNQLSTLEEILSKVKTLGRTDHGRINFSMKMQEGAIFSEKQMLEWKKINEAKGVPRFINNDADQKAEFPGGNKAMQKWIYENLQYPKEVIGKHIEGIASVDFLVKSDGKVADPKITLGIDPALNAEALKLIAQMPSWKPASKKGIPVDTYIGVQIHFDPK